MHSSNKTSKAKFKKSFPTIVLRSLRNIIFLVLCLSCNEKVNKEVQQDQRDKSTSLSEEKTNSDSAKAKTLMDLIPTSKASISIDSSYNKLKDGKKEGLWRIYHQNGQLYTEGYYKDGQKEGIHKEWSANGILSSEGNYKNGKANSLMKWYHEKGHLAGEGPMKDGARDGWWKVYDVEDGRLGAEVFFKDGKQVKVKIN